MSIAKQVYDHCMLQKSPATALYESHQYVGCTWNKEETIYLFADDSRIIDHHDGKLEIE